MYGRFGILFSLVILLMLFGCTSQTPPVMQGCTADAKICPDGSTVERVGPDCEFEKCPTLVGGDRDEHGCIPSAGYTWCEYTKSCIRPWETNCTDPDLLYAKAEELFSNRSYTASSGMFKQAREGYLATGNMAGARLALQKMNSIDRIMLEFSDTDEAALRQKISLVLPNASKEQVDSWLSTQYMMIDGQKRYFYSAYDNVLFSNNDVKRKILMGENKNNAMAELFDSILASENNTDPNSPYVAPVNYQGKEELFIPLSALPPNGTLKIWLPVPIGMDSQKDVKILTITPSNYLKGQPTTEGEIGLAYFEMPVQNLTEDVNISILFSYASYEQHFVIDPNMVGEYNKSSELYKEYTGSSKNIVVNPEVRALALRAVGNETNPYLQAEKLYWFVVNGTTYHFVPHFTLSELGVPESEYARVNNIGDCGTQSMYFSALARSLGIPARAPGGYQLFGGGTGTHFWAEFYLPNYGWIPVDVTAADGVDWVFPPTDAKNPELKKFFFANMDSMRFFIQKDVDLPVVPPTTERIAFPMVRQTPAVVIDTEQNDTELYSSLGFNMKVVKAS